MSFILCENLRGNIIVYGSVYFALLDVGHAEYA